MWYKDAVFYQISVRAYKDSDGDGWGDLAGITEKLDYLQTLGVDCLWLMPIYPSPLHDDGYDIADYYNIDSRYGNLDDFKTLINAAHARNIRIIMDLVLNHTSDEHPWFKASRSDKNSPYRDYYVWSDTDQKYKGARIIFLDTETSNWTLDETSGEYYWHRFYASQPDLNYDNPKVQEEMINIARFWLDLGIDGFRADAVPYLFEREGTNCENLPETHAYLKKLRAVMDADYPGRILLCEANQAPEDVRPYFGDGDEFHMGFHFPIMPRIYMALKKERADDMIEILRRTPPIPENCQWCTFLRNHDELTLEMVTPEERQWMWKQYAPEPRMRINLGIRRRLAPLLDNDQRKIELANSLLFTLPGSPIIYYGDEIGMGDNIELPDRNGVRTPMQWDDSPNAGFTTGAPFAPVIQGYPQLNVARQLEKNDSLFHAIRRMINIRKKYPAFGHGAMEWINVSNPALAVYTLSLQGAVFLVVNNLSKTAQKISLPEDLRGEYLDLLADSQVQIRSPFDILPYEHRWLKRL
ncbi:MAG: maltose alpha-D-glucosyltransferase [Anaerolineae bacterium]|nr:MAG: maltose alpha-D-glucosyltransferase [Anaerolineae bacterium]WKZ42982.1 MAG: maltose alpha-D-glucosyltransferase [Anaerolineales bacterium]